MSWKKVADLAAVVGTYKKDGQDKNKYTNCGVVLKNEEGRSCIKLTCLPFKEDGSLASFLGVYPVKDEDKQQKPKPQAPAAKADEFDDDIPF